MDSERSYSHSEALRELERIANEQEERQRVLQDDHEEADEILLGLIGEGDIRAAFERIVKWYA